MSTTARINIYDGENFEVSLMKCHDGYPMGMAHTLNIALTNAMGRVADIAKELVKDEDVDFVSMNVKCGEEYVYNINIRTGELTVNDVAFDMNDVLTTRTVNIFDFINKNLQPFNTDLYEITTNLYPYYLNNIDRHETELEGTFKKCNTWVEGQSINSLMVELDKELKVFKEYMQRMTNDNPNVVNKKKEVTTLINTINALNTNIKTV